jgi:hypothetical protein
MPVNQSGLGVQAGVTKRGVGNIWSNGIIEQPDANYIPLITTNWATDYT